MFFFPSALDGSQHGLLRKLREMARQLHRQDPYEVADENW